MQTCTLHPAANATFALDGYLAPYVRGIIEQWLLVAPKANPAMLEMFRDRDNSPLRQLVPWAGEFAGVYLTSAVEVCRLSGDARLRSWISEFVSLLLQLQDDDGYLGPWPRAYRLANKTCPMQVTVHDDLLTWDTWGHYHIMLGLLGWYQLTGDEEVLGAVRRIGDFLCESYLGEVAPRLVETGYSEMNLAPAHSLCLLFKATGEARYLDLALQLVGEFSAEKDGLPLAGNYLNGALAGTEFFNLPKPRWESLHPIMALAELYSITGDDSYRAAFSHLWWSIARYDRHCNGGFSAGEQATGDPYHPGSIETCCTIAWIALSIEMLKLSGDSRVADELEFSVFNSVTGMHSSTGRWATYNTPMDGVRHASAHSIVFQAREGSPELNCCSVSSPRGLGTVADWALMTHENGLTVNWYGPGTMAASLPAGKTVKLTQTTDYPRDGAIQIALECSEVTGAKWALDLRIPSWSRTTTVAVNGEPVAHVTPGQYLRLERNWRSGDSIEILFDFSLRFWRGEANCAGFAAVYRGPLLLNFDQRYNGHLDKPYPSYSVQQPHDTGWLRELANVLPTLDARSMQPSAVNWDSWMPPWMLLEVTATDGQKVRLCDFGSAGEAGTVHFSWLKIDNCPGSGFSRENPLRTASL